MLSPPYSKLLLCAMQDCDSDADCEGGLVCREREILASDEVSGCVGVGISGKLLAA
jgi:hypothetical protein